MPSLVNDFEYYPIGHDDASSQIDHNMMLNAEDDPISLFYGDIGDGCHMFAKLISILALEKDTESRGSKIYHLTINDLKACAIARVLVILNLLDDLATKSNDNSRELEIRTTLFYVCLGAILPQYAYDDLQATIKRLMTALESGQGLLAWLQIPMTFSPTLLVCLRTWQGEVDSLCDTPTVVDCVIYFDDETEGTEGIRRDLKDHTIDERCIAEAESFLVTGAHWPPRVRSEKSEPQLARVLE